MFTSKRPTKNGAACACRAIQRRACNGQVRQLAGDGPRAIGIAKQAGGHGKLDYYNRAQRAEN